MMNMGNVYDLNSARDTREVESFRHEALECMNSTCKHEWVIKLTKLRKEPKDILCPKCKRYTGRFQYSVEDEAV